MEGLLDTIDADETSGLVLMTISWAVACKAPNEAFCCITAQDCQANGVDGLRPCDPGLACKQNTCVAPSCSSEGCSAAAPICDTVTDECTGCSDSSECSRFSEENVCDSTTGACVECLVDTECEADKPVCDAAACRGCELDTECASGACAADGTCAPENSVVYVDPTGTDTGECSRATPCKSINFAIGKTSTSKPHVVLASATYTTPPLIINSTTTPATELTIHGGGATITCMSSGGGEPMFGFGIPATLKDATLEYDGGIGHTVSTGAPCVLERITVRPVGSSQGGFLRSLATVSDYRFETSVGPSSGTGISLGSGANLTLSRAVIRGGRWEVRCIDDHQGNECACIEYDRHGHLARYGLRQFRPDLRDGCEHRNGGHCYSRDQLSAHVLAEDHWTPLMPGSTVPPISSGCSVASTIAGPIGVIGGENTDPRFVKAAGGDFHIGDNSPAIDRVDLGPDHDFEGDPRPNGARWDLGADERQ
jgi:hypothetical protein